MKYTKKEFKDFVLNEAKKYADEKGFSFSLKENLEECGCDDAPEEKEFLSSTEFEQVQPEEFMEEAEEAKQLSEELTRMKQLLNFNNPLLNL